MRGGFRPPFGGRPNLNHWNMNRAPRMRPNGFRPQGQGPPMNNPGYGGPQRPMMGPPMGVGNIEQFHLDEFPHPSLTPDDVMVWIDEQVNLSFKIVYDYSKPATKFSTVFVLSI